MNKTRFLFVLFLIVFLLALTGCPFLPSTQKNYSTSSTGGGGEGGVTKPEGDDYEIDNTKPQASLLNQIQYHTIHKRTDIDFMKINAMNDKTYNISLSEIDGFYPQVSLYHQNSDTPFFTISPFIDSWNETIVYESGANETLYITVNSKYNADLFGTYKIGCTVIDTVMLIPANLSASDGEFENKIAVSWNATSDASSYEVYRSSDGNDFTKIGETVSTSYDDTTSDTNQMTTSINYIYKVRGKKNSGSVSSFSNSDSGYLKDFGKITDLAATVTNGVIRLTWTNIPGVSSYRIYRSPNAPDNYSVNATVSGSPYDVLNCQPEITYYFYIIPVKNGIDGFKSNIASTAIPFTSFRPNAPAASDSLIGKINIKWDAVNGATGYQLFRADVISGTYTQLGIDLGNSTLTYDDYSVTTGNYYYYRIKVIKNGQYSAYSYSDSGIATE